MRTNVFERWIQSLVIRLSQPQRRRRRHGGINPPACIERLDARILLTATTLVPSADGYATDQGLNGTWDTLNTTSDNNSTRVLAGIPNSLEDRGLIDFNISGLAAGNTVNSATLNLTISSTTTFWKARRPLRSRLQRPASPPVRRVSM